MNLLIAFLGLCGLVGCFDVAFHMTTRTRHTVRLAIIVVGLGSILALGVPLNPAWLPYACALFMGGATLFRIFDKRTSDYAGAVSLGSGGLGSSPTFPVHQTTVASEARLSLVRVEHPQDRGERRLAVN